MPAGGDAADGGVVWEAGADAAVGMASPHVRIAAYLTAIVAHGRVTSSGPGWSGEEEVGGLSVQAGVAVSVLW